MRIKLATFTAWYAAAFLAVCIAIIGSTGCEQATAPVTHPNYYEQAKQRALEQNAAGPQRGVVCFSYWNGTDSWEFDCVNADGSARGPLGTRAPEPYAMEMTVAEFHEWQGTNREFCDNCTALACDLAAEITVTAYWNPACQCWRYHVDWGACGPEYNTP